MTTDDTLLFIDANKYLDLYRMKNGRPILEFLSEQANQIFVPRRIVDEVQRQKINVVASYLRSELKNLETLNRAVPDHLFGTTETQSQSIKGKMAAINHMIKELNDELKGLAENIVVKVSQSIDEVSAALAPIFARAIHPTEPEVQRARARRESGHPPGKQSNPIGDQLNWEQILTRFTGRTKLWIITNDSDYGTQFNGKGFLNRYLYEELSRLSPNVEVFLFDDIPNGIKHYVDLTGITAQKLPTPDEIDVFRTEESGLPPLGWLTEDAVMASVRQRMSANAAIAAGGGGLSYFLNPEQGGGGFLGRSGSTPSTNLLAHRVDPTEREQSGVHETGATPAFVGR